MLLPRIGNALAKFIRPVSGSGETRSSINQDDVKTPDKEKKNKEEKKEPHLKLVEGGAGAEEQPPEETTACTGFTSAFLGIISTLQKKKSGIGRWIGANNYLSGKNRSSGGNRKGAMFDREAG